MSRLGVQGFLSDRLAQILAVRRLTQAQLAALVGVSTGTVSKWKSGTQVPEPDKLLRLASVVNVEPDWFSRPLSQKLTKPLFRSNASAHTTARAMLEARLEWAQDVALTFSEFVDFPEVKLPQRHFLDPDQIVPEDIECAADEFRTLHGLGKGVIQDLSLAVEGAGAIVIREETGAAQIEGLSAWSNELGRPVILLSSDKENAFRSRFDLAHELGHLILHKHVKNPNARETHKKLEKQAHYFAGALLMPAEVLAREAFSPVSLDDLLILKRRHGVSVAAIIMRLKALKIISEEEAQNLFKRRSARWGAKSEPGDNDRTPEQTRLLKRTIDLLAKEGVMPLKCIPRHAGLSENDVAKLAGLPDNYFTGTAEVVQLATLRPTTNSPLTPHASRQVLRFQPKS